MSMKNHLNIIINNKALKIVFFAVLIIIFVFATYEIVCSFSNNSNNFSDDKSEFNEFYQNAETDEKRFEVFLENYSKSNYICLYEIYGVGTDCLLTDAESDNLLTTLKYAEPTEKSFKGIKKSHCYSIDYCGGMRFYIDENNILKIDGIDQFYYLTQ